MDDRQLLRQFVDSNSQEAFAALTTRYLNLVYSVCRRELDNDTLAEDVTQAVFLILARKASTLRREVVLSGWLFQTARLAAKNARIQETRRRAYEQKAAEVIQQPGDREGAAWAEIEPLLNQSLASLREAERECVLLRFFQGLSFAEVGTALGLSEEAVRKRVTRALEKMRRFLTKNGVVVPSVVVVGLLSAHAAKAAPVNLASAIGQSIGGMFAGHTALSLTSSHAYQISEGTLKAMKIIQLKIAAGVTTTLVLGGAATYGVVRGAASNVLSLPPIKIAPPPLASSVSTSQQALMKKLLADSAPSQYRTVALTGKVRLADGTPVGKVPLSAQVQNSELDKIFIPDPASSGKPQMATPKEQEISGSFAHTRADGTYTLYVGERLKYNIYIVPENLMKIVNPDTGVVAAAAEGVSGAKGDTVSVPDLVLTPGGIITGTVTDKATGRPIEGATVMSYGPHRPESSAGVIETQTDSAGTYRLRVAPGRSRIYESDTFNTQTGMDNNRYVQVAEGETKTQDFQITLK